MKIDGKEFEIKMQEKTYHCALDITMDFIGGKWKTVVLWYLRKDKQRFSALKRLIPSITEKMLTLQLRELEKDGLVGRTIYPEVPPRVEYYLTPEGQTLRPLLEEMAKWGRLRAQQFGTVVEVSTPKKPGS